ncbi:MAG: hypothetical protein MI867_01630 [Pseudomonadales bacterium]|nr:hypothetical protein [Pseudomonadales bacterium]
MRTKEIGHSFSKIKAITVGMLITSASFMAPVLAGGDHSHDHDIDTLLTAQYGPGAEEIARQVEDVPLDFEQLHTYDELVEELYAIAKRSRGAIKVGPLIKNEDNSGLVDIDIAYDGQQSLRDAVINTVSSDAVPTLGNTDPEKIGFSNMGREIMAARFGHGPKKVVYITQQHGNEYIETEAAFGFLKRLSYTAFPHIKKIEDEISLLMIVRANPDGSEPDPERCQMGTPFPPPATIDYDCAFYRFNIDPTAGTLPTGDEFRGAFGVGYNLNRYHVAKLDKPIRPVEAQAMVAAIKAFEPNYILDFHGDIPKVTCDIAEESISPVVPGLLYDSVCASKVGSRLNDLSVRDMAEFLGKADEKSQRWNALVTKGLRFFGVPTGRHRQFNEATEILNTAGDYSRLTVDGEPIHTMLLELKNLSPKADPFISGMNFDQNPVTPKIDFALNGVLGQRNHLVGKIVSEIIMFKGLWVIANGKIDSINGDGGYSQIPEDSGFLYEFTETTMQTLGLSHPGPYIFPLCTLQPCLTNE